MGDRPTDRVITVGGVNLAVVDTGGSRPAVVLLHGLAGYGDEWAGTRRALRSAYRVVTFDQRGHGCSSRRPPDVSREAYVRDVVAVAERLGLVGVTLVGQSMGGHTALLAAAQHPEIVERLVLVESGVGGGGAALTAKVSAMLHSWPVPFPDRSSAAEWFGAGPIGHAWAEGLDARPDGLWPCFDVDVMVRSLSTVHEREAWTEWGAISQPTLLVSGANGLLADAEIGRMLQVHANARHVLVEDAGHDLHLEAQARWLEVLTEFLDERAPASANGDVGKAPATGVVEA